MRLSERHLRRGAIGLAIAGFLLAGCGDNSAEQQKQAAEIAKGIEDYLTLIEVPDQPIRIRHDKVTVTPTEDGKSFQVAITNVRYGTDKDARATFGEIDYRLTPQGDDQYLVSDLKTPKEMPMLGADGKPEAVFKFETTAFSATWSKPLQNFLKFDWQVKDFAVTAEGKPGALVQIATAAIAGEGKESVKGRLDTTSTISLNGLAASDPTDGTNFKLDKLTGKVAAEHLDFPAYRQMMEKLNALTPKFSGAKPTGDGTTPPSVPAVTDEDRKALADLLRGFPNLMSAYGYDFTAEGLTVTDAQGGAVATLSRGGMAFGLKGIDTDHAEANFGLSHDGLALSGPEFADPLMKAALPKSGKLSLVATDLPIPSLVEVVAKNLPELTSADPEVAQGGQFMMMGALMSALSQSTIKLRIDPSEIVSEQAKLTADGDLKLALQTPQKAVGVINFALFGLDDLIALASSLAEQNPEAGQAVGVMQMVKGMAQRETGTDGKPVDKYKVDLTETGQMLVNGKSLDQMAP